jgi:hypothetical protein
VGWLGSTKPNPSPVDIASQTSVKSGECGVDGLNGQAYYNVGRAWNDLGQYNVLGPYDEAIHFFKCSESAINNDQHPDLWWQTRAFLYRDWGYALLGERKCPDAKRKFEDAKKIFDAHNFDDKGASQDGIIKAQQCK